jgi:hypothetical protein
VDCTQSQKLLEYRNDFLLSVLCIEKGKAQRHNQPIPALPGHPMLGLCVH